MTSEASESEFGTYFGGKSGAGVYQTLINRIPRHSFLIVPFAGHCAITRRMRPAYWTVLCDTDADVIGRWQNHAAKNGRSRLKACHGNGLALLQLLNSVPCDRRPYMMVSSYFTMTYAKALGDWDYFEFQSQTRGGPRTESVWKNYTNPTALHDYRYLGGDKQERFKLERRRRNLLAKLKRLPAVERNALMQAAMSEFKEEQRPSFFV